MLVALLLGCAGGPDDTADTPAGADTGEADGRSLAEADAAFTGETSDAAGNAVAFAPRAEGAAIAVAASFASEVCVFDGGTATRALAEADTCWSSPHPGDFAGYALAGGADLDGDGAGDLLVGAVGDATQGPSAGAVYVLAEPLAGGARPLAEARTVLLGESAADLAGSSVAFAGDVDGDDAVDLLVGALGHDAGGSGAGRVYLLRGPLPEGPVLLGEADVTITGAGDSRVAPPHGAPVAGDGLGAVLDGAGDLDGDGLADLALGANGNDAGGVDAGVFAVFLGPVADGALRLADADQLYLGDAERTYAGDAVAAAGDLDGDGLADVLVGGGTDGPGTTWVVAGPGTPGSSPITALATSFVGEADLDYAGAAAARAGDLDGDGHADVIVGAYGRDAAGTEAGAVYLARGPFPPGVHALADAEVWHGEAAGDNAGRAVAGGADADGDGLDDVLVGAPYSGAGGRAAGRGYLLRSE